MDDIELTNLSKRKVALSVSIPLSLAEVLDRIAFSESADGRGLSKVVSRVLRKGLRVERDERAALLSAGQAQ